MRTAVLASLIAASALVSMAEAQTPASPPAPAAQTAAPPAPPATAAPTAVAPASPDATAPAAAPAAEPPPSLPTGGNGAVILSVIEKVCVPLVRGGNLDDIAK